MTATSQTDIITRQFGIESIPESVHRLNHLIAKRDASIEDFAKLVSQDKELAARVLQAANPRAETVEDYTTTTVEDALQRTGMSSALLLAMTDPLLRAVTNTFHTMLAIGLKTVASGMAAPLNGTHQLGEVTFVGKATGLVHLRLPPSVIPLLGERLLGLSREDFADPAVANDVVGELCNIIVGGFKSNLCDAGLNCKLMPPKITTTSDFKLRVVEGGTSQRHAFKAQELAFYVDLSVNPWSG
jgi:CheY-specific phosphatase CheX